MQFFEVAGAFGLSQIMSRDGAIMLISGNQHDDGHCNVSLKAVR
jgi:hypothetical protein